MIAFTLLFAAHAMGRTRKADPIAPKRYFSVEASAEASQLEEQASFEALQAEVQQLQADKQQLKEENQKLTEYMALKDQVAALRADKASLLEENQRLHDELDPHAEEHAGKAGENQRLHNGKVPAQEGSQPHAGALLNTTQAATHNASAKVKGGFRTLVYVETGFKTGNSGWGAGSRSENVGNTGKEFALVLNQFEGSFNGDIFLVQAESECVSKSGSIKQALTSGWRVIERGYITWCTDTELDLKFKSAGHDMAGGCGAGLAVTIEGESNNIPGEIEYPVFAGDGGSGSKDWFSIHRDSSSDDFTDGELNEAAAASIIDGVWRSYRV